MKTVHEEPKASQDNPEDDFTDCFIFREVIFIEDRNGHVRCGVCEAEFARLIVHMNGSSNCSKNFNMAEFKIEYSKFRHKKRLAKSRRKQLREDPVKFKENANKSLKKHEEKRKAENQK